MPNKTDLIHSFLITVAVVVFLSTIAWAPKFFVAVCGVGAFAFLWWLIYILYGIFIDIRKDSLR